MNWLAHALYVRGLRLRLWDANYAIRRLKASLARQREELVEREASKDALETELFNETHELGETNG